MRLVGADRRRSERQPHVAEAWLSSPTSTAPEDRIEVTSLNISRHGVAFEVPKALPTGQYYVMEIGVGNQRLVSEVRVVSCRRDDHMKYEIGADFC